MKEEIKKILEQTFAYNIENDKVSQELLDLFNVMPRSYGIVRWHDNDNEDVVCINKEKAQEYVDKYNKLIGTDVCYVDEDIYLPLNEA